MKNKNLFILTGAMGGGKSTIIEQLEKMGIESIPEPARQILKEQRSISSSGVPEHDPALFSMLMLSRAMKLYIDKYYTDKITFFDRGIPDMIAYAELFQLDTTIYRNAANKYIYNNNVFLFEGWKKIYTNDDERKMNFQEANNFGKRTFCIYKELGYNIIKVPKVSVQERARFINKRIIEISSN